MKQRLHQFLSVLCALALILGCVSVSAMAEEKTDKVILVTWQDDNNYDGLRPSKLTVKLGDGENNSVELNEENGWAGALSGKDTDEWSVPDVENGKYVKSVTQGNPTTVLFIHNVEKDDVSATVTWDDSEDAAGIRPESTQLRLLADGEPYGAAVTVNKAKSWTAVWSDVPVYKPGGETKITYTVSQVAEPAGYSESVSGLSVTNRLQTGTLVISATMAGLPEGTDTSKLTVTVEGPDTLQMPITLSYSSLTGESYTVSGLLPGAYLIKAKNAEEIAEGYTLDYTASVTVASATVKDGESTTAALKATYKVLEPVPTPAPGEPEPDPTAKYGQLEFEINGPDERMPLTIKYSQFNADGKYEIDNLAPGAYTVIEKNAGIIVDGYVLTSKSETGMALQVEANGTATASLFNQYKPAPTPEPDAVTVDIPVTKTWNDRNNADGNRPANITVHLYADGAEVDSHVLTAAEGWAYTFTELPRFTEANEEIKYTVNEDPVEWYTAEINGTNIINTYNPEVTSLTVSKVWEDNNNELGRRPTSIAVTLSNGMTATLDATNNWTYTFTDLPTRINGEPVTYSVREQEVLGYTGTAAQTGNTMVFTNTLYERPELPPDAGNPRLPGETWYLFEEYETPLGVEVIINHVGDCFD